MSLTDELASKSLKCIGTHLPQLGNELADPIVLKVIKTVVLLLWNEGRPQKKAMKTLSGAIDESSEEGSFLAMAVMEAFLNDGDVNSISVSTVWKSILSSISKNKGDLDKSRVSENLKRFLSLVVTWFTKVTIAGAAEASEEAEKCLNTLLVLLGTVKLDGFSTDAEIPILVILALLTSKASADIVTESIFGSICASIVDGIAQSRRMREILWDELNELRRGIHEYSSYLVESEIPVLPLIWAFLTHSLKYASNAEQLDAKKWIELIFDILPEQWPLLPLEAYASILEKITFVVFRLSHSSSNNPIPTTLAECFEILQKHFFSPHPLLYRLSVDLLCIIIKCTTPSATTKFARSWGALLRHFVTKHYQSTSNLTLEYVCSLNETRTRLCTVTHRFWSVLSTQARPEIDEELKNFPLFKALEGETAELQDADLVLIDLIPWRYTQSNPLRSLVVKQLHAMLAKSSSHPARSLLVLRAIYRLTSDLISELTFDVISQTERTVTRHLTNMKNSTSKEAFDGESIALILDTLDAIRSRVQISWKLTIANLSDSASTMEPIAQIALLQFVTSCLCDPELMPEAKDIVQSSVSRLFERLMADTEWTVASEAIISFFAVSRFHSIKISNSYDAKDIIETFSSTAAQDVAPPPATHQKLQIACQETSQNQLMDSLVQFKANLLRFAATSQAQNNPTAFKQLIDMSSRLAQLESSISKPM